MIDRFKLDTDIYLILLAILVLLAGLTAFIIYFIVLFRKRQALNLMEKERLALTFQQELTKTQLEVQEQTMQTIGADLHDNIGQLLSLTSLTLNSIEPENQDKWQQKIDAAIDLTGRSIKEMRLLGKLLQGDQLIKLGLSEAIRHEVNWLERSGKYSITHLIEGDPPAVHDPDKDLILFRILQEVLNNIIKHAEATRISIRLEYLQNALRLEVDDNGVGFNMGNMPIDQLGMGLHNINKRAGIVGGEAIIKSGEGKGTSISIHIPYP